VSASACSQSYSRNSRVARMGSEAGAMGGFPPSRE
jgi:hypothetical protein